MFEEDPAMLNIKIGIRVQMLRKRKGIPSDVIANRLGITIGYLLLLESGERILEPLHLIILSREFKVSVDYIIRGDSYN